MLPARQGSFKLFRLWGVDVHVHWSWFLVAFYSISTRVPNYTTPLWGVLEYLALFLIVLMHEFGHAMACRQVGGSANQIVLWPLGGIAFVAPPARPGATLWSIAAGPLVNVALLPVLWGLFFAARASGTIVRGEDLYIFIKSVAVVNTVLLAFNVLPIYPLDGGQILRSLLWYPLGKARSLMTATVVGMVGGLALVGLALWWEALSLWTGVMIFFLLSNCWKGFQEAQTMRKVEQLPRRAEFACPECKKSPPSGNYWLCPSCRHPFDPFATAGQCPQCHTTLELIPCPDCGSTRGLRSWDASIRDV